MNTCIAVRPEERRRTFEGPAWADTVPACFRSEAFAEDLPDTSPALPPRPVQRSAAGRTAGAALTAQSAR